MWRAAILAIRHGPIVRHHHSRYFMAWDIRDAVECSPKRDAGGRSRTGVSMKLYHQCSQKKRRWAAVTTKSRKGSAPSQSREVRATYPGAKNIPFRNTYSCVALPLAQLWRQPQLSGSVIIYNSDYGCWMYQKSLENITVGKRYPLPPINLNHMKGPMGAVRIERTNFSIANGHRHWPVLAPGKYFHRGAYIKLLRMRCKRLSVYIAFFFPLRREMVRRHVNVCFHSRIYHILTSRGLHMTFYTI